MKFLVLGVFYLHFSVITSQLIPTAAQSNQTSKITLKRSTRSVGGLEMEYVTQKCHGCNDENAGICSMKKILRVHRYTQKLKCLPEATLVKLEPPAPYYSVEPSMAKVNRCGGYCNHGFHTCLPKETSFIKIPVMLRNHQTGLSVVEQSKCVEYEVEQHKTCECDCEVRKEHCSVRHRHESCSCKCQNEAEKYKCLEDSTSVAMGTWDEQKCECICEREQCSVGFVWNASNCRCEMVSPSDIENFLY